MISTRSSTVNSGCFSEFSRIASRTRPKTASPRADDVQVAVGDGIERAREHGERARPRHSSSSWLPVSRGIARALRHRRVEAQAVIADPLLPRARERPILSGSARLWKCSATTHAALREQPLADQPSERLVELARVRRVEVDDVEAAARVRERLHRARRVLPEDLHLAARLPERAGVLAGRRHGRRVAVDEHHARGAARQRLEPDAAAAGERVQEARASDARREDVEERLPHARAGRAGRLAPPPSSGAVPCPLRR